MEDWRNLSTGEIKVKRDINSHKPDNGTTLHEA